MAKKPATPVKLESTAKKAAKPAKVNKKVNMSFKVENIVASANLMVELDLFNIAMEVDNVEYEPEQFPGAIMRLKDIGTTLLLFKNGKVICSGAKSERQIKQSIERAVELLKDFVQ
ncbi:TATA box-binding protein [Candidatus Micrarchaeota archaeon]|nr:TATA box-binding protein [Candidatus Micrarchaeota archaeon]MBI5176765.1 TATA box-binding protein [Candidatus Micrarchaeota archaeon]